MAWQVEFSKQAAKQIKKLDHSNAKILMSWIGKNLVGTEDPRIHGKALKGCLSGVWRYRVGDYRILTELHDNIVTVLVLQVGHCREVYNI